MIDLFNSAGGSLPGSASKKTSSPNKGSDFRSGSTPGKPSDTRTVIRVSKKQKKIVSRNGVFVIVEG